MWSAGRLEGCFGVWHQNVGAVGCGMAFGPQAIGCYELVTSLINNQRYTIHLGEVLMLRLIGVYAICHVKEEMQSHLFSSVLLCQKNKSYSCVSLTLETSFENFQENFR